MSLNEYSEKIFPNSQMIKWTIEIADQEYNGHFVDLCQAGINEGTLLF